MLRSCKLKIIEHSDALINEIDLKAEQFIQQNTHNDQIEIQRAAMISEIKAVESFNLENLQLLSEEDLLQQNQNLLNDLLFKSFCFIFNETQSNAQDPHNQTPLIGSLIVTDKYLSPQNIEAFESSRKIWEHGILKNDSETNLLFNILSEKEHDIQIKYSVEVNELILRIPSDSLFAIDELKLTDCLIESVKPDAAYLFRNVKHLHMQTHKLREIPFETILGSIKELQILNRNSDYSVELSVTWVQTKIVNSAMFRGLTNLHTLRIANSKLESLDLSECEELVNLKDLVVGYSEIKSLEPTAFKSLRMLRKLALGTNDLTYIHPETFSCLDFLQTLDLGQNSISSITGSIFKTLKCLESLRLEKNLITKIDDSAGFSELSSLKVLLLSGNKIDTIRPSTFNGLRSLRTLYLDENSIQLLEPLVFNSLSSLKTLCLCYNQITAIEADIFESLINLEELYLNNNFIRSIDPNSFRKLKRLKYLNLSSNEIMAVDSLLFQSLEALQLLHLRNNRIESLEPSTFRHLENLKALDLSYNKLSHIHTTTFRYTKKLNTLNLYQNKIESLEKSTFEGLESQLVDFRVDYHLYKFLDEDFKYLS